MTVVKDDDKGTLLAIANNKITSFLSVSTYAKDFADYLDNFNDDGTAITTGGTAKDATFKDATFSSSGEGNLLVDIVVNYGYDEHLIYKWLDYDFVSKSNNDVSTRYAWSVKTTVKIDDSKASFDTNIENGKAMLALI